MTEQEWLASEDPAAMLAYLLGHPYLVHGNPSRISDRKARLWVEVVGGLGFCKIFNDVVRHKRPPVEHMIRCLDDEPNRRHKPASAALLRDIIGNPFRPWLVTASDWVAEHERLRPGEWEPRRQVFRKDWLAHNDGAVLRMARHIYESREFEAMPVLADLLEDVGCNDETILSHCRGVSEENCPQCQSDDGFARHEHQCFSPHVRGCWVLDLILGRE